uniref:Holliday junction branch migration protein RuvA n=1 Tax=Alistipes sp. TaxID=1872444 RepID=UPI004057034D
MYEYIQGKVAEATPTYAVIEAGGVGYLLHISLETFSAIETQSEARLYTHYIVREDAQLLYGFHTKVERELFRLLISVSGVGGNTARMILSTYSPRELRSIITSENAVLLKNVKGLGLKTAQKIIVELSGKLVALGFSSEEEPMQPLASMAGSKEYDESLAALVMLGFQKAAAEKTLKAIFKEMGELSAEEAIRAALKRL